MDNVLVKGRALLKLKTCVKLEPVSDKVLKVSVTDKLDLPEVGVVPVLPAAINDTVRADDKKLEAVTDTKLLIDKRVVVDVEPLILVALLVNDETIVLGEKL